MNSNQNGAGRSSVRLTTTTNALHGGFAGAINSTDSTDIGKDSEEGPQKSCGEYMRDLPALIVGKIADWGMLALMLTLPAFTTSYVLVFAAPFTLGLIVMGCNFFRYRKGYLKVFPKVFEVGILSINFTLLLFEIFVQPSHAWNVKWAGLITTVPLFALTVFSVILKRPFTLEFAKERVSEDKWHSPVFIMINYHVTYVWGLYFLFSISMSLLFIVVIHHASYLEAALPALIALGLAFLFTSHYPPFARQVLLDKKKKELAKLQQAGVGVGSDYNYSGSDSTYYYNKSDLEQPIL